MNALRKIFSVLFCCGLLVGLALVLTPHHAHASDADELEPSMLGKLSEIYESNGNPAAIASVSGDPGGKSYGLYMFASSADSPKTFFTWCQASSNTYYQSVGNALSDAYYAGTPGYGTRFDETWRSLATENPDGFAQAQRDHVRALYYDRYIAAIQAQVPAFDVADYSIALRNVLWSRAIQHGVGGATRVFTRAMDALGGFANQPESVMINAIYMESGRLNEGGPRVMSGATARRYGVEGKSLAYYSGCSGAIQLGVYIRLRINEPAKAQAMLAEYGHRDAVVAEGNYMIRPAGDTNFAITAGATALTIDTLTQEDTQHFRLRHYASGYYTVADSSGKRLTAGENTVTLSFPVADDTQFWELVPLEGGYALQNRSTGQYLSAASFSSGDGVSAGNEAVIWQLVPGDAVWSLENPSYPTYASDMPAGSSFPFRGILHSTHNITSVRAEVQNDKGKVMFFAQAAPDALFYDLSQMDRAMAFSRLDSGSYVLIVTAKDASGAHYELREPFYIRSNTFTAILDPDGGKCDQTQLSFVPGQVLSNLPTPTKSGMSFTGWYDEDGNLFTASSTTPARDMVLTAHYEKLYSYTFYDYDESTILSSGKLIKGKKIPLPANPSRPNTEDSYFLFTGWSGYEPDMTMGTKNLTFVAQYEEHDLSELGEMVSAGPYRLIEGYLRVIPAGTTAEEILAKLTPKKYISLRKGETAVTGAVGTGMTVDYAPIDQVIQSATIVVTGDVNGDGVTDITDMMKINSHLLEKSKLTGAAEQAADINGDGVVDITDFAQILSVTLRRRDILPN